MMELHQRAKAKRDLKEIWLYTFKEYGEEQADKYYDELIRAMLRLSENPSIGTTVILYAWGIDNTTSTNTVYFFDWIKTKFRLYECFTNVCNSKGIGT
jgi:hypothetical protein